jgi:beta-xylosidase
MIVPDPDGGYWAVATNGNGANVQTLRSTDLTTWEQGPEALPELPEWTSPGKVWAPEVVERTGGGEALYYTSTGPDGVQCVGVALGKEPEGPFTDDTRKPLVCEEEQGGTIDAHPFVASDGGRYLYWKNDGNCCGKPVQLWAQRLSPDAGSLQGSPVALLSNTRSWQGNLIEAPEMVGHGGRYFLFYSANDYGSDKYAVGYASCQGPTGPCADRSSQPLLSSDAAAAGPGHCFVLDLADGSSVMFFHAWQPDAIGSSIPGRQLWMEPLEWVDGGPRMAPPS